MAVRYIAFLRAVNVGGRVVKMPVLKKAFESLQLSNVETFIASGNVVFETAASDVLKVERKIESRLREALGYEVTTSCTLGDRSLSDRPPRAVSTVGADRRRSDIRRVPVWRAREAGAATPDVARQ